MKEKETNRQNLSEKYCSPSVRVITVDVTQVLCQSERMMMLNTTEMGEGDENW